MELQQPPTILIVDDSATTRRMIKRAIGASGISVGSLLEAADGLTALSIMESAHVDLVLADLNMPLMDGAAMIAQMRRREALQAIPIIVISAQPDPHEIQRLEQEGVVGFLPKPFAPASLAALIAPLLESRDAAHPQDAGGSFNLTLAESLAEALETMAFVSPELPATHDLPPASVDLRIVHVEFHGASINGSLSIAAPVKFGEVVAANCGDPEGDRDIEDAFKEFANVTCGLLLRKQLGRGADFKMTPPVLGWADEMDHWVVGNDVVSVCAGGFRVTAHVATINH